MSGLLYHSLVQLVLFLEAVLTDTAFVVRNRLVKLVSLDWISLLLKLTLEEFFSFLQCAASLLLR